MTHPGSVTTSGKWDWRKRKEKTYSFSFLTLSSSVRFFKAAIACWFNNAFLFFSAFSSLIFSSSARIASSSSSSPSGCPVLGCTPSAKSCSLSLFASVVSFRRSAKAREAINWVMWITCFVRTEFGFKRFRASIWRWISSWFVSYCQSWTGMAYIGHASIA